MANKTCRQILCFVFATICTISGYPQDPPMPAGQECEGTQIKTDDGMVFVRKGEFKPVRIDGKWYICSGCNGCVEQAVADPSSGPPGGVGAGEIMQKETIDKYDSWARKHGFPDFQAYFNEKRQVMQHYRLESWSVERENRKLIEAQAGDLYTRLKKLSSQMETAEAMTEVVSTADWGIRAIRASDLETARKWAGYFFDTEAAAAKTSNYLFSGEGDLSQALKELKELVPVCLQIHEKMTAANEKRTILEQKSFDIKAKKDTLKDAFSKSKDENMKEELKQKIAKLENEESDLLKEAQQVDQEASEMIKKAEGYVGKVEKIEKLLSSQGEK